MLFSGAALLVGTASGEGGRARQCIGGAQGRRRRVRPETLTAPGHAVHHRVQQRDRLQHDVVVASADPAGTSAETFLDGEVITGPSAFDYGCLPCLRPIPLFLQDPSDHDEAF
jgi:hypothetical protein